MAISKFFFQSLVSDYLEGLLPASRQEEISKHIDGDSDSARLHKDLESTVKLLNNLPSRELRHEVLLQIVEVAEPKRTGFFSRVGVSFLVLFLTVPLLISASIVFIFPDKFPLVARWVAPKQSAQFVRYYPLLQGANDVVELHVQWLGSRGPVVRSFWEEGGLSPDDFEKNFTEAMPIDPSLTEPDGGIDPGDEP